MPENPALNARRDTLLALLSIGERVSQRHGDQDWADSSEWRDLATGCTQQASLKQLQRDYLFRWNEGVGAIVEDFWREVALEKLGVVRKQDVVLDTLRRGRVLGPEQFYELEDHFEELQEIGKLGPEQADKLNEILDRFESNPKNFDKVRSRF